MLNKLNLDPKALKTFKFLNSLKLNFLSIERILKVKIELTFAQKETILNLMRQQYNIKIKANYNARPIGQTQQRKQALSLKKIKKDPKKHSQQRTLKNKKEQEITNIYQKRPSFSQGNLLELTKQRINLLRNASNNYNRMGQGVVKWRNPYYSMFGVNQTNLVKRHKNL